MSDIKNPAPFYTLKEAAKELNRQLKTDYYDSKKLLSMALVYDLKLHAYFYGDFNIMVDAHFPVSPELDLNKYEKIRKVTEEIIQLAIFSGALLEINNYSLNKIYLFGQSDTNNYGFCNITDLKTEILNQPYFFSCTPLKYKYASYIDEDQLKQIQILAIYPILETLDDIQTTKPNTYNDFQFEDREYIYHPIIRKRDVYITHRQLLRIIAGELTVRDNQYADLEDRQNKKIDRKPQGKSRAKEHAQIAAKTLANHLWNQDKDKKIKIKEMAITIYAELNRTEHCEQLPDQSISLKRWIEDVAPEYAREAGRTKENI